MTLWNRGIEYQEISKPTVATQVGLATERATYGKGRSCLWMQTIPLLIQVAENFLSMRISIWRILSVISLTPLLQISGCDSLKKVRLENFDYYRESILCSNVPGRMLPDQRTVDSQAFDKAFGLSYFLRFSATDPNFSPETVVVQITARDISRQKPEILVANGLKVGSTFKFLGVTWKVVQMGAYGIEVEGNHRCSGRFIHLKQVYP